MPENTLTMASMVGERRGGPRTGSRRRVRCRSSGQVSVVGIAVGVLGLPAPRVGTDRVEAAIGGPAELLVGTGGIGIRAGDVAGPSGGDLVGDRDSRGALERGDDVEDAVALARTEVPDVVAAHLEEAVQRGEVTGREVDDVQVVADPGAVV